MKLQALNCNLIVRPVEKNEDHNTAFILAEDMPESFLAELVCLGSESIIPIPQFAKGDLLVFKAGVGIHPPGERDLLIVKYSDVLAKAIK